MTKRVEFQVRVDPRLRDRLRECQRLIAAKSGQHISLVSLIRRGTRQLCDEIEGQQSRQLTLKIPSDPRMGGFGPNPDKPASTPAITEATDYALLSEVSKRVAEGELEPRKLADWGLARGGQAA